MNVDAFFYENPIFRYQEFEKYKRNQGVTNSQSIHSALSYYLKLGRIKLLRRELYGVVPPNESLDTVSFDPYLIAGKAAIDSVLSHHTALEIHGVAYSSFEQFTFISSKKVKPFELNGQLYRPIITPLQLKKNNLQGYGVESINRQGVDIKITNLARTYVDILDRADLSGGWEEVSRSINNISVLNIQEVIDYSLILKNSTLIGKVGYFLEQREGPFAISSTMITQLEKNKPTSVQYMGDHEKERHRLIKKWNLMVPVSVIEQSWNEPNYDV